MRMMVSGNDEAKRSRLWRGTVLVTSVLIVVIAIYLLLKMFTANPLEGTWKSEEGGFSMTVDADNEVTVDFPGMTDGADASVQMQYSLDKDAKTITMKVDAAELDRLAGETGESDAFKEAEDSLEALATTFDYNVESGKLTLTEREYGGQLSFVKK